MVRILPLSVRNIFYTFKQIIQFKQINSYRQVDMYQPFYSKVLIANLNDLQFLSKSIENRDLCSEIQLAGKPIQFRTL